VGVKARIEMARSAKDVTVGIICMVVYFSFGNALPV
jgi:hypothetical protein